MSFLLKFMFSVSKTAFITEFTPTASSEIFAKLSFELFHVVLLEFPTFLLSFKGLFGSFNIDFEFLFLVEVRGRSLEVLSCRLAHEFIKKSSMTKLGQNRIFLSFKFIICHCRRPFSLFLTP